MMDIVIYRDTGTPLLIIVRALVGKGFALCRQGFAQLVSHCGASARHAWKAGGGFAGYHSLSLMSIWTPSPPTPDDRIFYILSWNRVKSLFFLIFLANEQRVSTVFFVPVQYRQLVSGKPSTKYGSFGIATEMAKYIYHMENGMKLQSLRMYNTYISNSGGRKEEWHVWSLCEYMLGITTLFFSCWWPVLKLRKLVIIAFDFEVTVGEQNSCE